MSKESGYDYVRGAYRTAKRLVQLFDLKAPQPIIESEVRMLVHRIARAFPYLCEEIPGLTEWVKDYEREREESYKRVERELEYDELHNPELYEEP